MVTDTPQTIVVLGMHRSGTSALTGALTKAGVYPGDESTMYETDAANEKGYFEQKEAIDINEDILLMDFLNRFPEMNDYGYYRVPADLHCMGWLLGAWLERKDIAIAEPERNARIKKFLAGLWSGNAGKNGFLIKDPRLSLTFPVWEPHLGNPFIIVMVRHPTAVAGSIRRRDKALYEAMGHQLWLRYTLAAMQYSVGHKTLVIDYDSFIENPDSVVNEIFIWLSQNGFRLAEPKPAEAAKFVSRQMRHHRIKQDADLPENILEFYENIKKSYPILPQEYLKNQHLDIHSYPWQSLLGVLVRSATSRLAEAENVHKRLINHPVSGAVIRLLRRFKNDSSFGKLDYHVIGRNHD